MWEQIALWVVTTIISSLLTPRPKTQKVQPGQIGDKDVPIASQNAEIPVLFGTRYMTGPNIVWYGDLKIVPIKKKGGKK